jgi:hypothetical protein
MPEPQIVSQVIDCIHVSCMTHMQLIAQDDKENSGLFRCKGCGFAVVVSAFNPAPEAKTEPEPAPEPKSKHGKKEKVEAELKPASDS